MKGMEAGGRWKSCLRKGVEMVGRKLIEVTAWTHGTLSGMDFICADMGASSWKLPPDCIPTSTTSKALHIHGKNFFPGNMSVKEGKQSRTLLGSPDPTRNRSHPNVVPFSTPLLPIKYRNKISPPQGPADAVSAKRES